MRHCPVGLAEVDDRGRLCREQAESPLDHSPLALGVVRGAKWTTHWVLGDDRPSKPHELGHVAKAVDIDTCRWDTRGFDRSLNVSHGHVADRSDRHEQDGINLLVMEHLCPLRPNVFLNATLRRGADK